MLHPSVPAAQPEPADRLKGGSCRELHVLLAAPRGFCAGVRRAIDAVLDALELHGAPVYVRRPIVHNLDVVRSLEARGAIFVEELDEVPEGGVVLFSAHGVLPAIAADARRRGLKVFDAVCPLVAKVHREVEQHQRAGRQLVIVGHPGHPEIEGTLGHVRPGSAFVVSSAEQVAALPLDREAATAFAIQTTFSVTDAAGIVAALRDRFSRLVGPRTSDICYATTNRQAAVRDVAGRVDAVIVAGEHFSSNATRLYEIAGTLCSSVQLVSSPSQVDWSMLESAASVGLTAAASTPESSVRAILDALHRRYRVTIEELDGAPETTTFKRLALA